MQAYNKAVKKTPLVSIVTAVYNDRDNLSETIESVKRQNFNDYEFIVIDGGSTDGTLQLIEQHVGVISQWISEPDEGVYDAMNKGVALASGQWLLFLNSGDLFARDDVLKTFVTHFDDSLAVVYGDSLLKNQSGQVHKYLKSYWLSKLTLLLFATRVACHQSMFFNKKFLKPYSMDYKLKSELLLYIELAKERAKFKRVKIPVCIYLEGGLSHQNFHLENTERRLILKKEFGLFYLLSMPLVFYQKIRKLRWCSH